MLKALERLEKEAFKERKIVSASTKLQVILDDLL
jgi:hypothetical protein